MIVDIYFVYTIREENHVYLSEVIYIYIYIYIKCIFELKMENNLLSANLFDGLAVEKWIKLNVAHGFVIKEFEH